MDSTNHQLQLAHDFIHNTGTNLFLTGKAGTGKTTFLRSLVAHSPKRMVVLAPTGVAAINAGGATIHSFFQLPFSPYIPGEATMMEGHLNQQFRKEKLNIIRSIDLLVIDEISMVRADLLDAIDVVMRKHRRSSRPFGGVQLLLIGDIQQLAPVVKDQEWSMLSAHYPSPFFFNSHALQEARYHTVELDKIYRQSDPTFVNILNAIRENSLTKPLLEELNKRYIPEFEPQDKEDYITLTTHNHQANTINERHMNQLGGTPYRFKASIQGKFPEISYPTDETLVLKKGAQVMFVKNDSNPEKRYFNGKIGVITYISSNAITVRCEDNTIEVEPQEWENIKYTLNEKTKEIEATVEGKFTQYPLKTAWAITIHKSQGLTFDRAIINASSAFTHGQVYVALSRCRTLEGLVLSSPLHQLAIKQDLNVKAFTEYVASNQPSEEQLESAQKIYFVDLVTELFAFKVILFRLKHIHRIMSEHMSKLYPKRIAQLAEDMLGIEHEMIEVSSRFKMQIQQLVFEIENPEESELIQERLQKAAAYYEEKMNLYFRATLTEGIPETDNKELKSSLKQEFDLLITDLMVKTKTLELCKKKFSISDYLAVKAKASITDYSLKKKSDDDKKENAAEKKKIEVRHPELYYRLHAWRKDKSEEFNLPAYQILQQKTVVGIANSLPTTKAELLKVPGLGKKIVENFGLELMEIIDTYRQDKGESLPKNI